ncbi:DUF1513 domain-containing protein [Azospirillum thermophilum]|uniref:DUF1513 domain-containing protein n=1 Tax=Azospirillum thermophilum TaxID=2202148 RepID=A0A2S2CY30_9PROT|nr:DUF1513 domain-containing protein [Azospirillum thermophilum]AWK89325.1 DUF1513 domain-containing protein [Azospirillum thermophilum]
MTAATRRDVLALLGGGLLAALTGPVRAATAAGPLYLNAYATADASPAYGVAALDAAGGLRFATATPGRAHAVVPNPVRAEAVAFARRPGRWFLPLSLADGAAGPVVKAPEDRRFTGHGAFSPDGRLLFVAEDDVPKEAGAIAVYDAADGYRRLDALPTHGLGPHELVMIGGGVLAVANGGVITHPDTGRAKLNLEDMDSSLTYVEAASGRLLDKLRLPEEHSNLGIRHLAALPDGGVAFGTQDERPTGELQPLTGAHRPGSGAVRLFATPEDVLTRLDGYIGSVAAEGSVVAASSPKGGLIGLWDAADGRWLGAAALPDGCGVAPAGGGFLATSGLGMVETVAVPDAVAGDGHRLPAYRWDNHLTRI